jgi:hypothetical protein
MSKRFKKCWIDRCHGQCASCGHSWASPATITSSFATTATLAPPSPSKDAFRWSTKAKEAFHALQRNLTKALVLQLPTLDQAFIVECDASGLGFSAVLHQDGGSMEFFSGQIAPQHVKLVAYEPELISLVQEVCHWWSYLWGARS